MTSLALLAAPAPAVESKDSDWLFLRRAQRTLRSSFHGEPIRIVDLFSGCGGLSLGAQEACFSLGRRPEFVLAADSDAVALAVYRRNFQPQEVVETSIETVVDGEIGSPATASEIALRKSIGRVDLLLAGPPCQGFSNLNNHSRLDDPRNLLYQRVARFAEIGGPEVVFIENVPSILSESTRWIIDGVVDLLASLGYHTAHGVVRLVEIGVPQLRKRHILVASRLKEISLESVLAKHRVSVPRTVAWAIEDLADLERASGLFETASVANADNRERIKILFDLDAYDLDNEFRPKCHQNNDHTYKSMYGRLSWSAPAQTITSGFGSPGQGRYIHPSQPRTLTPHEAARLQFFPDFFQFGGVEYRSPLSRMIGNAVPPKLSWILAEELFAP
jgi:DNA (cytosine-5)-methyltransferase 1